MNNHNNELAFEVAYEQVEALYHQGILTRDDVEALIDEIAANTGAVISAFYVRSRLDISRQISDE